MRWKALSLGLAAMAAALGMVVLSHLREMPPPALPVIHAELSLPAGVTLGSGQDALDAAIAPDERAIAFVATRNGNSELWLQSLAGGEARPLPATSGAILPAWNRNGTVLAYFAGGKLRTLTLSSGAIAEVAEAPAPAGAAWLPDGSLIFAAETGKGLSTLAGGALSPMTALMPGDVAHAFPFVDAHGATFYIALRRNGARVVRRITESGAVDLTETAGHAEIHSGMLVHVRDNVLLAQRLDEAGTRLIGRSSALAVGVGVSDRGRGYFTASPRLALWAPAVARSSELAWFDAQGRRLGAVTEPGDYWQVRLSPDGRVAAVTALDPLLRTLDVFAVPLAAPGTAHRVSLSIGPDSDPVWSPDGTTLLYRSPQAGPGALMLRPARPSTLPESLLVRRTVDLTPSDWRGDAILMTVGGTAETRSVSVLARQGGTETLVTGVAFASWNARWSPDGRWVAYVSDESGQPEVYVQAFPGGTPRVRATFGGGQRPQWGRGGSALFFLRGTSVMRSSVTPGAPPTIATPQTVLTTTGLRDFSVSTDDRLLVIEAAPTSQLPAAHLILDWQTTVPPPPVAPPRL